MFLLAKPSDQQVRNILAAQRNAPFSYPFAGVHPEFDREIDPFGVVHVRMTIAGQGVFEASSAMVRLRPYSGPRDHQQQLRGRRFFYQETLGRGHRADLTWPVN